MNIPLVTPVLYPKIQIALATTIARSQVTKILGNVTKCTKKVLYNKDKQRQTSVHKNIKQGYTRLNNVSPAIEATLCFTVCYEKTQTHFCSYTPRLGSNISDPTMIE